MVWLVRLTRLVGACVLLLNAPGVSAGNDSAADRIVPALAALPLPRALAQFSAATHLQLVYVSQLALDKTSQPVPDGLTAHAALERLLAGTGLDFLFLNDRTIKLFETPPLPRTRMARPGREPTDRFAQDPLDEVVVTATKRNAMLSTVPMSIRVLAPEDLDASGMPGIAGIAAATTGIEYDFSSQYGPGILSNIAIRGIGADKGDATTGIYINDTPIQTPHTTFGNAYPVNFDLAQVEVLRGPQGVLFGRGAEGGAIRYITNEPSTTATSQLYRAEVSTTDRGGTSVEFGAAAGGPLVNGTLGARVSAWYREEGGYVNRIDPLSGALVDANANRSASRAVRASVAIEPDEALRITPSFSHQSINLHDTPVFYAAPTPPAGALNNGKLLRQPAVDDLNMASLSVVDRLHGTTLTSITSYMDRYTTATVDTTNVAGVVYFGGFGNPLGDAFPTSYADAVPTLLSVHQIMLTEEFRVASTDSAAPFQWLGGLFYSRLRQDSTQDTYLLVAPDPPGILTDDYNTVTETSLFGQARWSPTPYVTAGAGMRVGWLGVRSFSSSGGFVNPGPPVFNRHTNHERLPPTPRFDLSYQPDSRNLFYAAIAKGFRAGGYGGQAATCGTDSDPSAFGPDSVWSFEVGAKNQVFNRRLNLDVSVFDIHWNGIQERVQDACGNTFTTNLGAARSSGFDLNADARLTDGLHVGLSAGYLDVRYTRTVQTMNGQVLVDRGTVVGGVPSVPAPWSGTLSARYEQPLGGNAAAYLHAEEIVHSHNSGPFTELESQSPSYDPRLVADPAMYVLNVQLGMTWSGANVRLFVNNATNTQPLLQRYTDAPGSALVYAYTQRPRTVGVLGTWNF